MTTAFSTQSSTTTTTNSSTCLNTEEAIIEELMINITDPGITLGMFEFDDVWWLANRISEVNL
jgi:hypothetical protein